MTLAEPSLDEEFVRFAEYPFAEPDEFYERLRNTAPAYHTPLGYWFITRYDLVADILRDDAQWSSNPAVGVQSAAPGWTLHDGPASRIFKRALVFVDGKDHERLRKLVRNVFAPRFLKRYDEQMRRTVRRLLDQAVAKGAEGDFLGDYANMLPTTVILDLVGLSQEELPRFHDIAFHFLAKHFPASVDQWAAKADPAVSEVEELVLGLAARRRGRPTDDLLSAMVNVEEEGDRLTDDELVAMVIFLVVAGYETTANTLTNGMYNILRRPEQWSRLKSDTDGVIDTAVEEMLRFDGSVRVAPPRWARQDIEVEGQTIRAGERVYLCLHAANRDPAVFVAGDRFDITRKPNKHIVFSQGAHYCLGHYLARMEMKLSLAAIVERLPEIELLDPDVLWKNHFVIRGFESLPVRWGASRAE